MAYGAKSYRLRPIATDVLPTPDSEYALSLHKTYDPATRNKLYNMSGKDKNVSYGCVNNKECDLEKVTQQFPQGDTLMVVDSKNPVDARMLNSYMPKQYGLGSWLGENAGAIGTVVGAGIGTAIAPGIGTQIGASLGGSVGGAIQSNVTQNAAEAEAIKNQQLQLSRQNAVNNLQAQNIPQYGAQFALGGFVPKIEPFMFSNVSGKLNYAKGGMLDSFKCGGKMYAGGGMLETTSGLDGMTYYANGGTHESNKLGGVPVGRKGLVEQGEFRFGDYIFSNRF